MSLKSSNNNDIFDSLTKNMAPDTIVSGTGSLSGINSIGTSNKDMFSFFENISWTTWILIILVLAILGFNIFAYLAKGTQLTANILGQGSSWISGLLGPTAQQTVDVSATGAKTGIDVVAGGATDAINVVSGSQGTFEPNVATTSQQVGTATETQMEKMQENTLSKSLNDANQSSNVQTDDSYSSIQMSKSSGKSGWCYIGEEKGVRSCVAVGVNDMCMSGDIFPTSEVCVNPNLRV